MKYRIARKRMVEEYVRAKGVHDEKVLEVMLQVPRHRFVSEAMAAQAYGDCALPIGEGQTISQPAIVGKMTEALQLSGSERVLEVGTGSAYQATILSPLAKQVYTVERIEILYHRAKALLKELGCDNVACNLGDGSWGLAEEAPFDRIIVTAEAESIPQELLDQLTDGGRLVIPIKPPGEEWGRLKCIDKIGDQTRESDLGGCRFVKLVRDAVA